MIPLHKKRNAIDVYPWSPPAVVPRRRSRPLGREGGFPKNRKLELAQAMQGARRLVAEVFVRVLVRLIAVVYLAAVLNPNRIVSLDRFLRTVSTQIYPL